jgi:hypothetical protein
MNPLEQRDGRLPSELHQPATVFPVRAWKPTASQKITTGNGSESPYPAFVPQRAASFSERFRSVSEYPRYLTQGMGANSA